MNYFQILQGTEKEKVLSRVNRYFDKQFWHHYQKQKHEKFAGLFPYESKNIPVRELTGNAKKLYEYQNKQEIEAIKPIYEYITNKQAKHILKYRKSLNHSTFKKWAKSTKQY